VKNLDRFAHICAAHGAQEKNRRWIMNTLFKLFGFFAVAAILTSPAIFADEDQSAPPRTWILQQRIERLSQESNGDDAGYWQNREEIEEARAELLRVQGQPVQEPKAVGEVTAEEQQLRRRIARLDPESNGDDGAYWQNRDEIEEAREKLAQVRGEKTGQPSYLWLFGEDNERVTQLQNKIARLQEGSNGDGAYWQNRKEIEKARAELQELRAQKLKELCASQKGKEFAVINGKKVPLKCEIVQD
jgi:chromosome segregation ATPase